MLDSTLDDARSKNYVKIVSSQRLSHAGLPAIRSQVLDTRKPETATVSLCVMVGNGLAFTMVTAAPSAIQSDVAEDFLSSLSAKR